MADVTHASTSRHLASGIKFWTNHRTFMVNNNKASGFLNLAFTKEYRVLKKEGASSRNFVYTLGLAIKPKKSGKLKNHATYTISIDN